MPINCGPILISSVSLPVAVLASAMCGIFGLRGPVLWLVSSYVSTLFLLRAPARTAATGPLAPLVGAVARAARSGAVLVKFGWPKQLKSFVAGYTRTTMCLTPPPPPPIG
jgi:hypothetical protein